MVPLRSISLVSLTMAGLALSLCATGAENEPEVPAGLDELIETGRELWEEHAPEEIKEHYEFPSVESVEEFLRTLEQAFENGSFAELAAYEFDARNALAVLRRFEGGDELADWLEPRVDFLHAAGEANVARPLARPARPGETPPANPPPPAPLSRPYWERISVSRQPPARAGNLVPQLKSIFAEAGVPEAWVWIAEVESSMNPKARSPAGARGLFQFMPQTAERFGLRTSWPDQRTDPARSARAAAEYLRLLHGQFGSWPLALAAYNAGEGRVSRAIKTSGAESFPALSPHLPAETRMYVPKVLATVAAREGLDPENLPPPRAP